MYVKIGEPDLGVSTPVVPKPLRQLTALTAVVLALQLVSGTLVTGAGPHAGDKSITQPVPGCRSRSPRWFTCTRRCSIAYLALVVGLGFGLLAVHAPRSVMLRLGVLLALVVAQGLVGTVQFFTGVPAALVAVHVLGAAACTAATAALWASMRQRTEPQPLKG